MAQGGQISVPEVCFNEYNTTKNSNQELLDILLAIPDNQHWVSTSIPELSRSGSQYIVPRFDGNWFKNDGFTWQRRKNGSLVREDHSKLKVQKQDCLNCYYVTSAIVKGFQRRVYQLLGNRTNNEYVLIHYLYSPDSILSTQQLIDEIVAHIKKNGREDIGPSRLAAQLQAILADCYDQQTLALIAEEVYQRINGNVLHNDHDQHPGTSYSSKRNQLERRNSCSSAFRKGLSSMALRRQPSTFSDSVDTHFMGAMMNNEERKVTTIYQTGDDVRSYSGETQRSSNPDEDSSVIHPASLQSVSAGAASLSSVPVQQPVDAVEIIDVAPSSATTKGGTRILIIGDWYMKGHEYSIRMGDKKVPARLIRPGVLLCVAPPATNAGAVMLQVMCNEQIASQPRRFVYEDVDRDELLQFMADRLHLIGAAFGLPDSLRNLNSSMLDQEAISVVLRSLEGLHLMHPSILATPPIFPSRTIIHLAAQLDFPSVINQAIILKRSLPYIREFDPLARDAEGCTPLHHAARSGNYNAARILMELCPNSVDVLDDRNRTAMDLATGEVLTLISRSAELSQGMSPSINSGDVRKQNVNSSTALWVLTNGETVTDSHLLRDRRLIDEDSTSTMSAFPDEDYMHESPSEAPHLEITMDTDVELPDSPKMAEVFQAATSPVGMLNENNRQEMVNLAKQIIDALPARIKNDTVSLMDDISDSHMHHQTLHLNQMNGGYQQVTYHLSPMIGAGDTYWQTSNGGSQTYSMDEISSGSARISNMTAYDNITSYEMDNRKPFSSSNGPTFDSTNGEFHKNLGEFFNLSLDGDVDPVQQRLGNLKLNDNEQRELYEAAMVIQRAYREYRERNSYRRQAEVECRAAVTIQSCYRRYKQYCYIKQLHSAAIVVQKHFRLKKGNKEGTSSNEVQEHPTLEGQILRIQVPQTSSSLSREHRAATTIQTAYRGHRKRQAAARKIQKFMKETSNRQKQRRMAEQNVGDSIAMRQMPPSGGLFQGRDSLQHINESQ